MPERRRPPLLPAVRATIPILARRPSLWLPAWQLARSLVPTRWWLRWPPLPLPDAEWMRFRTETAYGRSDLPPAAGDVIAVIEWAGASRSSLRFRGTRRALR